MAAPEGSGSLYRRALKVLPGGVNSPVRAMGSIGRDPVFIERGEGPYIWDADGNRYVDWVCSWGPLILGHAHPAVVDAVQEAAARGTSFGAPTEGEVTLAAEVVDRFAAVEMVRMTSSGTEASMSAIRLARAATGRDPVLKFAGAYHGHVDGLLAEAGSGLATAGVPASPGVTESQARDTTIVPWNDRDALAAALAEREFAAIMAEPIPANMGVIPPDDGFLDFLRGAAEGHGALLILDEVISGFRVARGGAQELLGVRADLTVMGKVLGGGLPAAAYGGSRELMERVAPAGDVYQAGTLSGNPLAVAAGPPTSASARSPSASATAFRRRRGIVPSPWSSAARSTRGRHQESSPDCSRSSSPSGRPGTSPRRAPATSRHTPASAGRCWSGASTRRRPPSRPGSPPLPTTRSRSS